MVSEARPNPSTNKPSPAAVTLIFVFAEVATSTGANAVGAVRLERSKTWREVFLGERFGRGRMSPGFAMLRVAPPIEFIEDRMTMGIIIGRMALSAVAVR